MGSEVDHKGRERGMSKWHSQTGDAPSDMREFGRDEIFGESGSSCSDLAACRRRIKSPGSLVIPDFCALLRQLEHIRVARLERDCSIHLQLAPNRRN